jgi:transcriptional regulator with XRE-family HTH domain
LSRAPQPDLSLAEAVVGLRRQRGLSVEALAFRSGITPSTLSGIELAQMVPRWDTVRLLARGLSATLVELCAAVERSEECDAEEGPVA